MQSATRPASLGWLAGFLVMSLAVAALGGHSTSKSVKTWYPTLRKPSYNPPSWVFGPVWTVLYALMAVSAWLVQREARASQKDARWGSLALGAWVHQLALNATWSWVFFGRRQIGPALGVLVSLWLAIVETIWLSSRVSKRAAALLAPYLAWTTFAGVLNFRVWQLNRGAGAASE